MLSALGDVQALLVLLQQILHRKGYSPRDAGTMAALLILCGVVGASAPPPLPPPLHGIHTGSTAPPLPYVQQTCKFGRCSAPEHHPGLSNSSRFSCSAMHHCFRSHSELPT